MPWLEPKTTPAMQLDKRRIAVLPFANISRDAGDEYFADGMTEELIDRLSQVRELKVIARTSVMSYKNKEKKASEIGKELRAGSLVEGSVRKSGNRIRVTVQLIDASTEEHLWSSRYDKDLDDIFAVQGDIASRITTALAGTLAAQQTPTILEKDTDNITAYSYFLQGRHLLNEDTEDSIEKSLKMFEKAITLDPSFARAHAYVAASYIQLEFKGHLTREQSMGNAKLAAQKALNLNERLAEVHSVLSRIAWIEDDYGRDELEAKKAIELNPNLASAYSTLAMVKATNGDPNEALRLFETAYLLDPLSHQAIRSLGVMYLHRGMEREAEEHWTRNLQIDPQDVLYGMAIGHLIKGNYEKAEETLRSLEKDSPEDFWTISLRGYVEALEGNREAAERIIETLHSKYGTSVGPNQVSGFIRYFLGDMDAFFAAMFRDVENHALNPLMLRYSPLLEKARQDPRYRELMTKASLDPYLKE
jgi:adenylate cyclase